MLALLALSPPMLAVPGSGAALSPAVPGSCWPEEPQSLPQPGGAGERQALSPAVPGSCAAPEL